MNFSDICIFTRTYAGDREFLPFLYKSIDKYCSSWGVATLVVESGDLDIVKPYVPSWVQIITEEKFAPGVIQQKFSKITADLHTDKNFIFHIDSDSVFTKNVELSDLFFEGKPYLEYASYDYLLEHQNSEIAISDLKKYCIENVLPIELRKEIKRLGVVDLDMWMQTQLNNWISNNFESWFADFFENWKNDFGVDVWRLGTESAIGVPVNHEFSRRPEKLYPRELYPLARSHIETIHNVPFKEFISSRIGKQQIDTLKNRYFSDLNFLGSYLYNFMHSNIEWIDVESKGYEYRKSFVKQFISYDLLDGGVLKPGAHEAIISAIA